MYQLRLGSAICNEKSKDQRGPSKVIYVSIKEVNGEPVLEGITATEMSSGTWTLLAFSSATFNMFPHSPGWLPKFLPSLPESSQQEGKEKKSISLSLSERLCRSLTFLYFRAYLAAGEARECHLSVRQQ